MFNMMAERIGEAEVVPGRMRIVLPYGVLSCASTRAYRATNHIAKEPQRFAGCAIEAYSNKLLEAYGLGYIALAVNRVSISYSEHRFGNPFTSNSGRSCINTLHLRRLIL